MVKKKAKAAKRKASPAKKAVSKKNNSANETEDAKAIAEKIFANLKKPKQLRQYFAPHRRPSHFD